MLGQAIAVLGIALLISWGFFLHEVPEGHVGMYYRGGALLDDIKDPGFHWRAPFTRFEPIQVSIQTDSVTNIACGTSGGVMLYFGKVDVVNRLNRQHAQSTIKRFGVGYDRTLIFDRVESEINQWCSQHTVQEVYIDLFSTLDEDLAKILQQECDKHQTGIDIIAVRVTKPTLPPKLAENYLRIEEQKTERRVTEEKMKVTEQESKMELLKATMRAQREAEVARIEGLRDIVAREVARNVSAINNQINLDRVQADADAVFYRSQREAEANKLMFTPEYIRLKLIEAISKNTKLYFAPNVSTLLFDDRVALQGIKND